MISNIVTTLKKLGIIINISLLASMAGILIFGLAFAKEYLTHPIVTAWFAFGLGVILTSTSHFLISLLEQKTK